METVNTILSSAENMQCALDIESALPEAKARVMRNFFYELKQLFENAGRNTYDCSEDTINEYYLSRKHTHPYLSVKVINLSDDLIIVLYIAINYKLYFGFGFVKADINDEFCDFMDIKWIRKTFPDLYGILINFVDEYMAHYEENDFNHIFVDLLYNDRNEVFDFKRFTPSCVDLASQAKCAEQAKRIFQQLNSYVDTLSEKYNL
jgi:hypothetical protein